MIIGKLIQRIRNDKKITQKKLAEMTDFDLWHIKALENGRRHPSYNSLKLISMALDVPLIPLQCMWNTESDVIYDKYNAIAHLPYNKIPIFESAPKFIDYPRDMYNSMFAYKITDTEMAPSFNIGEYVFIELNTPLFHRDYGLFSVNGKTILRRFLIRKNQIILRADSDEVDDIAYDFDYDFTILGKVIGKKNKDF